MGNKIDQLEKSINELIDEAGIETTSNNSVARKGGGSGGVVGHQKMPMGGQHESDTAEF